jgi:hypothetical protein
VARNTTAGLAEERNRIVELAVVRNRIVELVVGSSTGAGVAADSIEVVGLSIAVPVVVVECTVELVAVADSIVVVVHSRIAVGLAVHSSFAAVADSRSVVGHSRIAVGLAAHTPTPALRRTAEAAHN